LHPRYAELHGNIQRNCKETQHQEPFTFGHYSRQGPTAIICPTERTASLAIEGVHLPPSYSPALHKPVFPARRKASTQTFSCADLIERISYVEGAVVENKLRGLGSDLQRDCVRQSLIVFF
jgi:hypothetical protein